MFTVNNVTSIPPELLAEALNIFVDLLGDVSNDVFTDSPERAVSVTNAVEGIVSANEVLHKIQRGWKTDPKSFVRFHPTSA